MTEQIWLALIVAITTAITTTITPIIMAIITARQVKVDRDANWDRDDAIAARATAKLDTIHTLVNSNMTAAMQAAYDATVREAAMMQEVMDLKKAAGQEPTAGTLAALETTKSNILVLKTALIDRGGRT